MKGKSASAAETAFEKVRGKQAQHDGVAALATSLSSKTTRRDFLRSRLMDARDNLRSLQGTVERDKQGSERSPYEAQLQEKIAEVESLERALKDTEQAIEKAREELQTAKEAAAEELQLSIEDVKASQKAVSATRCEIERLEGLAAEKRQALTALEAELEGDERQIEQLHSQREDYLAEVALGRREAADVSSVDEAIGEALDGCGAQKERLAAYRDAVQTLAGLERQLERAKALYEGRRRDMACVVEHHLRCVAAAVCADYRAHAEALVGCFSRLAGLNQLIASKTGTKPDLWLAGDLQLPRPTSRMPGAFESDKAASIFGSFSEIGARLSAAEAERARLADQGIGDGGATSLYGH